MAEIEIIPAITNREADAFEFTAGLPLRLREAQLYSECIEGMAGIGQPMSRS